MSDIKTEAINKAINWLKAANCKFHVMTAEGSVFGEPIIEERKRAGFRKVNDFAKLGYIQDMQNMKPGDDKSWELGELAKSFKKTLCGQAIRFWGSGTYVIQSTDSGKVTILRME